MINRLLIISVLVLILLGIPLSAVSALNTENGTANSSKANNVHTVVFDPICVNSSQYSFVHAFSDDNSLAELKSSFSSITAFPTINGTVNFNGTGKEFSVDPAILDGIGQEEAKLDNIQHVTYYGRDDAIVMDTYGYGDCWADASYLYDKLSAAGVPVRIMAYQDGGWGNGYRHTWIEINVGHGWQMWNYSKYESRHVGYEGFGTPYVLIEPGHAPADILSTGY